MKNTFDYACCLASIVVTLALAVMSGCGEKGDQRNRGGTEGPSPPVRMSSAGPEASAVPVDLSEGWCGGHGVPESVCIRCNSSLIPRFKEANDWCAEHGLPESQCVLCNPEVEAKWASLNPANAIRPTEAGGARAPIQLEPNRRLLTGSNDSRCQVDRLRVRFLDATTARKAGIETEMVQARRLSNTIECPAEVDFDQTRLVRITPRVPGVVTDASVEVGSLVNADDLLAVLESPALGEAKNRYIRMREG